MQNWKKAIVFGSIGIGAALVVTRRRPLGMAFAATGLAVLASEYPEKFEAVWENAPEYLQKGMQIFSTLQKMGEGFAEEAERRSVSAWRELRSPRQLCAPARMPPAGIPCSLRLHSIPNCLRASGLSRSGVHCGYHTMLTVALPTPGIRSRRCCECRAWAMPRSTSCGIRNGRPSGSVPMRASNWELSEVLRQLLRAVGAQIAPGADAPPFRFLGKTFSHFFQR